MQIHEIRGHIQSIYLVAYPDRLLLLDGGCRCDVPKVENFVASLGRSMSELKIVVVTHMHPDHAGGAQVFRQKYGCKIASQATDKDWYAGWKGSIQHLIDIFLAYWVASRMKRPFRWLWYPKSLRADYPLSEGDRLPGFSDWQLIETPGHTDRDISLFHADSRTLYIADAILKVRGRYITPFPVDNPELYARTVEMISRLGAHDILLAHGGKNQFTAGDFQSVLEAVALIPRNRDVLAAILRKLVKVG